MISIDGTEVFRSDSVHCDNRGEIKRRNGPASIIPRLLALVIVHPTQKQVIPLAPEPIEQQDGTNQNDGELRAIERFLAELRREHPKLKLIVLLDGFYVPRQVIELSRDFNLDYLMVANRIKLTQ